MNRKFGIGISLVFFIVAGFSLVRFFSNRTTPQENAVESSIKYKPEIVKSDAEWKKILTSEQYHILREQGTDIPFTHNDILHEKRPGTYVTADCNEPVFRSETKFDSGTGWPSFYAPIEGSVVEIEDNTLGIKRVEIVGKKCGGHLGHVFEDGPEPTGLRYCINATALKIIQDSE